jgi:DUF971 family protein
MTFSEPLFIRQIRQTSNHAFQIAWSDGIIGDYLLSELQKRCPCAACSEKAADKTNVHPDVRALKIVNVGRYAIKISFTSGCSMGIYHFDLLHSLAKGIK